MQLFLFLIKKIFFLLLKFLKKHNIKYYKFRWNFKYNQKAGYNCTELAKYTGFKEMLDGRVKHCILKYMLVFFMIDKKKLIKMK